MNLELSKEEAQCLLSNLRFAVDQLSGLFKTGEDRWEDPEIGEEVAVLNRIIGRLDTEMVLREEDLRVST